jgi:hypothetical protein
MYVPDAAVDLLVLLASALFGAWLHSRFGWDGLAALAWWCLLVGVLWAAGYVGVRLVVLQRRETRRNGRAT